VSDPAPGDPTPDHPASGDPGHDTTGPDPADDHAGRQVYAGGARRAAVISCDILLGPDNLIRGLVFEHSGQAVIDIGGCRLIADRHDLTRLQHAINAVLAGLTAAAPR